MIQALQPRFNRQAKAWQQYAYVKLTAERFPRLDGDARRARRRRLLPRAVAVVVGRAPRARGDRDRAAAAPVHHAHRQARRRPMRACRAFPRSSAWRCARAAAQIDDDEYDAIADARASGIDRGPALLLEPARSAHGAARGGRTVRGGRRDARPARGARRARCAAGAVVEQLHATELLVLDTPEGRVELRRGRHGAPRGRGRARRRRRRVAARAGADARRDRRVAHRGPLARTARAHACGVVTTRGTYASALPRVGDVTRWRGRAPRRGPLTGRRRRDDGADRRAPRAALPSRRCASETIPMLPKCTIKRDQQRPERQQRARPARTGSNPSARNVSSSWRCDRNPSTRAVSEHDDEPSGTATTR